MKENSMKWKDKLLSSSIPLEYEVAKILNDLGFKFSYDYAYFRYDNGASKEFSVDLKELNLVKVARSKTKKARIISLIECKYRNEGKKCVFLSNNMASYGFDGVAHRHNTHSATVSGYAVRNINEFSRVLPDMECLADFESKIESSLKGTEVSLTTGEVFDTDIRHGIAQLKYALPYLVREVIDISLFSDIKEVFPYFVVPILVTNADLHLLKEDFSVENLKKS